MVSSLGPKGALTSRVGGPKLGRPPSRMGDRAGEIAGDPVQPSHRGSLGRAGGFLSTCICGSSMFLHHVASFGDCGVRPEGPVFPGCRSWPLQGCPWVEEQSQLLEAPRRTSKKRVLRVTPVYRLALIWHLLYPLAAVYAGYYSLAPVNPGMGLIPISQVRSPRPDWAYSLQVSSEELRSLWS